MDGDRVDIDPTLGRNQMGPATVATVIDVVVGRERRPIVTDPDGGVLSTSWPGQLTDTASARRFARLAAHWPGTGAPTSRTGVGDGAGEDTGGEARLGQPRVGGGAAGRPRPNTPADRGA